MVTLMAPTSAVTAAIASLLVFTTACGSDVVRLPDCIDCRPVEMTTGQTLEVELGSDRAVSSDPEEFTWSLVDTGDMRLLGESQGTRPEDEDEFIGGYSRAQTFTLQPTKAGTTKVEFNLLPTDGPAGAPAQVLDLTVIVKD